VWKKLKIASSAATAAKNPAESISGDSGTRLFLPEPPKRTKERDLEAAMFAK